MTQGHPLALTAAAAVTLGLLAVGIAPATHAASGPPAAPAAQAAQRATASSDRVVAEAPNGRYIVRLRDGASHDAFETAAASHDITVVSFQSELHTVVVESPAAARHELAGLPGVVGVAPDDQVMAQSLGFDPKSQHGSMTNVTQITGATEYWKKGWTGKGVDVAIIDTGIAPVPGLLDPAKVIVGTDLSFESQNPNTRFLDSYGHGTNMAGIIAGRETAQAPGTTYAADTTNFYGMAPDARLLSVKLADHGGAVDVSQMIAAIDWVVKNQWSEGMNIKVLNISYGTNSKQDAQSDPLSWAAEVAWKAGIAVVASAGNDGEKADGLASPAYNPWVIAVGAQDTKGTATYTDDSVPSFSERAGAGGRGPDLVAPGVGIVSLGVPGANLYEAHKPARLGNDFLRGNGTSQSAAVVSGAAALLMQQFGWMNPDTLKNLLKSSATTVPGVAAAAQGSGALNLRNSLNLHNATAASQNLPNGTGKGTLENARGGQHVTLDGATLTGEVDIMGNAWSSSSIASQASGRNAWDWNGSFNGAEWAGGSLTPDATSWAGKTWKGKTWISKAWKGKPWPGQASKPAPAPKPGPGAKPAPAPKPEPGAWDGRTWSSAVWNGRTWSSASWDGPVSPPNWSGRTWSSAGWK